MAKVIIYTAMLCPYCGSAKSLLKSKQADFEEVDVTFKPGKRHEMQQKAGGSGSVPQIWIDGRHVGGCRELYALEDAGDLDGLLRA
ncbi:MAG: glutaredoxin 3 [Sphingomonadales bacterium]